MPAYLFTNKWRKRFRDLGWLQAQYHEAFLTTGATSGFVSSDSYGNRAKRLIQQNLYWPNDICGVVNARFQDRYWKADSFTQKICMFRNHVGEKVCFLELSKVLDCRRKCEIFFFFLLSPVRCCLDKWISMSAVRFRLQMWKSILAIQTDNRSQVMVFLNMKLFKWLWHSRFPIRVDRLTSYCMFPDCFWTVMDEKSEILKSQSLKLVCLRRESFNCGLHLMEISMPRQALSFKLRSGLYSVQSRMVTSTWSNFKVDDKIPIQNHLGSFWEILIDKF